MTIKVGDKVGNKIYSGPDYGLQTPTTYLKLKKSGAFKFGSQEIRRAKTIAQRLYDRHAPQQVKDAVTWFGKTEERANQRLLDRGYKQADIDKANAEKASYQGDATDKFLRQVSDKTNVAPEIINTGAFLLETAAEGLSARAMARSSLKGLSKAPAPTVHAHGGVIKTTPISGDKRFQQALSNARKNAVNANHKLPQNAPGVVPPGNPQRVLPLQQPQPRLAEGQFPGGSREALARETKVRAGISQKVRDIQSGKATPSQSSINKASDQLARQKAEAAAIDSTTPNRVRESNTLPTVRGDSTEIFVELSETQAKKLNKELSPTQRKVRTYEAGDVVKRGDLSGKKNKASTEFETQLGPKTPPQQGPKGAPEQGPATRKAESVRGRVKRIKARLKDKGVKSDTLDFQSSDSATEAIQRSRKKGKNIRERNLLRDRAQKKAVDKFFSGEGKAATFPSKKGKDVRTPKSGQLPDDAKDYISDVDGLYDSSDGLIAPGQDGVTVWDGERASGSRGKPGQSLAVRNNIQQQNFSEIIGVDLSKLDRAGRRKAILSHITDGDAGKLSTKDQNNLIAKWIKDNSLTDQAVRDRVSKRVTETRFPEQFNQIEAEARGGVELPARNRNTADRTGRKTRPSKGEGPVNPDRDYVLGKGAKPRQANKIPNADKLSVQERIKQRTQTNEVDRSDNIPGGRRIKQSTPTYKKRIEEARARVRARGMSSMIGKRRPDDVIKADKKARASARKQGVNHNTKLPQTMDGVADQQFNDYPKGRMDAEQKRNWKQEEANRESIRTLESKIAAKARVKNYLPDDTQGNRGRQGKDTSLEDFVIDEQARKADKKRGEIAKGKEGDAPIVGPASQRRARGEATKPAPQPIKSRAQAKRRNAEEKRLARLKVENPSAYEKELKKFLKKNVPDERFVSPQDDLKNPNPFTSDGEVRGVKAVRGKNPTLGEGEVTNKVKSYGDPAREGRSKKQRQRGQAIKERALKKKSERSLKKS